MAENLEKTRSETTSTKQNMLGASVPSPVPATSEAKIDDVAVTLALSESTLRALSFLGSKKVVDSVLDILELEHGVSINDVARRPAAFVAGVESMFGPGSYVITRIVCAQIAKDLGVPREGKTLPDLVKIAQERLKTGQSLEANPSQG